MPVLLPESHSLSDIHEIAALNAEKNIVSSAYNLQIILFLLSLKN
jgi:hypothetical protein